MKNVPQSYMTPESIAHVRKIARAQIERKRQRREAREFITSTFWGTRTEPEPNPNEFNPQIIIEAKKGP